MIFRILLFSAACLFLFSCGGEPKILVFSKTADFRHASVEAGVTAIRQLGLRHGFQVEATEDSAFFTEENLRQFDAVVFMNTSGDVLNYHQQADFQRFIEAGGGFVGVHGAAATEYDWKWYGRLVGAYFSDHPEVQAAKLTVADASHPATKRLPEAWVHADEWYNFRPVPPADMVFVNAPPKKAKPTAADFDTLRHFDELAPASLRFDFATGEIGGENVAVGQTDGAQTTGSQAVASHPAAGKKPAKPNPGGISFLEKNIQVLLTLDETSYEGGKNGAAHPVAWRQDFEGGRSFYLALGHAIESYSDENFLKILLGGIRDAIGKGGLDYSKAKTQRIPPEDRFIRTVLAENLDEPTELDVFPDGKVIFVERKGAIKIYDPEKDTVETVCHFPVYHAEEEGLMGVALDPNWEKNRWIYLFYSLDDSGGRRNRLSRFEFFDDMLHLATEKPLLEVPELYGCCHTGGSIVFDARGNLFLSTGDNTNPFESDGYAPIDERPGRALWDAQKSSANANDLRGKILRITPQPDGTYSIPEGNLFPKGTPGTRPEIFVMGCRNPYRISVDSKTGCVFWGDVGPDAGVNRYRRGPKGYDTVNRACSPGNYGWPLARGNHVYFDYDFATKKAGDQFDALRPLNDSPNNTGIRELPPVQSPLIWYSYDESLEFPWTATGGKNPMAGPVFHASDFAVGSSQLAVGSSSHSTIQPSNHSTIFPEYFEDKLFIYEWMRNWIYVVTLDPAGNFTQADPFLPSQKFSRPMDMAFGKDGALYVLEYGTQWFAANPDARLNKIEYAPGNRQPAPHIHASQTVGAEPLAVHFSADSTLDYDGDALRFQWSISGENFRSTAAAFDYVFNFPGKYEVVLKVTDSHGATSRATKEIVVGNSPPNVAWEIGGNQTFFWDNENLPYRLIASDLEDGNLENGKLDARRLKISIDYLAQGQDVAAIVLGHLSPLRGQGVAAGGSLHFAKGKVLIDQNDCKTCHAEDRKVNGPSYVDIANRYYGNEFAEQTLRGKVIKGGAGNWGETAMSAHPNLTESEAAQIVKYILSLAGEVQVANPLPWQGNYLTNAHLKNAEKPENQSTEGAYVFQASYRDEGRDGSNAFAAKSVLLLRHPKIQAETFDKASKGVRKSRLDDSDTTVVKDIVSGRHLGFEKFDLTGVGGVELGFLEKPAAGWQVEVRLDAPDGELAGKSALAEKTQVALSGKNWSGVRPVYFVFKNDKSAEASLGGLDWVWFRRKAVQ